MDLLMYHLEQVNFVAVLVAILPSFIIGGIWRNPALFGKYWMKASGLKPKDFKNTNFSRTLGVATAMNFVAAAGLATLMLALGFDTPLRGAVFGALVSLAFAATSRGVHAAFEYRPLGLLLLNGAHDALFLAAAGAIIGAF